MTGDIDVQIDPIGFGRYHVTVSFPADLYGGRWLLTGLRFGRRRAGRLADQMTATAMDVMAAREDEPA